MRTLLACLLFALLTGPMTAARAQDARPLRLVVGFAPGGGTDVFARLLAAEMQQGLGRPVVVENRPGANGNIAADHVAKSAPDGATMLVTYNTHPVLGALYARLPFDPLNDFRAVALIAGTPYLLVARADLPGHSLAEALALARRDGRAISFGSVGAGSPQHLSAERLKAATPVPITIVHYKGGAPAQNDVLAGHVDIMLSTVALGLPHVKAGRIKALAVSSAKRLPALPDVPTIAESGFDGFVAEGWYGLLLPAKTPADVVRRYNDEVNRALKTPRVRDGLDQGGATPLGGTAEAFEAQMRDEQKLWARIIRDAGIKPE